MIVGERKPIEEIVEMIKGYKRVLNVGCGGCTSICLAGGQKEVDILNAELRKAVRQSKSLSEISTQFRRAKMLYLQEQALRKVVAGTTAINEMVRVLSTSKGEKAKKPEEKT